MSEFPDKSWKPNICVCTVCMYCMYICNENIKYVLLKYILFKPSNF